MLHALDEKSVAVLEINGELVMPGQGLERKRGPLDWDMFLVLVLFFHLSC